MKPETPEQSELVSRLRQQLILAQVRIMELEDVRDILTPRLAETERLLREAQLTADRKLDETSHLENVLAGLQGQYEQLSVRQQKAQLELASLSSALNASRLESAGHKDVITQLENKSARLQAESAARLAELGRLETEQRAMRATRSWRWTAWLRGISGK